MENDIMSEVIFNKYGHPWLDAGLIGFFKFAMLNKPNEIELELTENEVIVSGESENTIKTFLEDLYDKLTWDYYTTSTEKQTATPSGFYYDKESKKCVKFPKAKPMGTAGVVFSQAPTPTESREQFKNMSYEEQQTIKDFLKESGIKSPLNNIYINGRNKYHPKADIILPIPKKPAKSKCAICGGDVHKKGEYKITSSILPMKSGGCITFNSFYSDNGELACWKCNYISKFVPVIAIYTNTTEGNKKHTKIIILHNNNLKKLESNYDKLTIELDKVNLMHNCPTLFNKSNISGTYETIMLYMYNFYIILNKKDIEIGKNVEEFRFRKIINDTPRFYIYDMVYMGNTYVGKDRKSVV